MANQLWCIDFLTPPTPLIIPHRLPVFLESLMPLKNRCSIHAWWSKSSLKHSIRFCGIFPSLKQNFIAYHSSKVSSHPDCIFENHQQWQLGFSRVYSNSCCSYSFEPEIIKIDQSSHKMYSNNIVNSQESTTIINACTKKSGNLLNAPRTYVWNLLWPNTTASSSLSMFAYHDSASDATILMSFISVAPCPSILESTCIVFAFGLKYAKHRFSWMEFFKFWNTFSCVSFQL